MRPRSQGHEAKAKRPMRKPRGQGHEPKAKATRPRPRPRPSQERSTDSGPGNAPIGQKSYRGLLQPSCLGKTWSIKYSCLEFKTPTHCRSSNPNSRPKAENAPKGFERPKEGSVCKNGIGEPMQEWYRRADAWIMGALTSYPLSPGSCARQRRPSPEASYVLGCPSGSQGLAS